jgi:hypothetical protein
VLDSRGSNEHAGNGGAAPSARCSTISKVRSGLTPAILAIYATVLLAVATLRLRRSLVTP